MKKLYTSYLLLMLTSGVSFAQLPHDVIYMPKQTACVALAYNNNSWNQYWENTLKRDNLNLGTVTTQSLMPMVAYGVTDKLNAIVSLPYISTKTSAGNLMWQKGVQDLSLWLKYKLVSNAEGVSLHTVVGGSVPMSNYVPDFLPLSIGLQSKTATARLIGNYAHKSGLYLTAHGSYTVRSKIKIDRDSYLSYDKVYNTNEVALPNTIDAAARLGFLKKAYQTEVFVEHFACVGGDDIRRNDMPFPTNNMRMTSIGWYGKFQPKNIGVSARVNYVLSGQNVGQTLGYSVALLYQINNIKF